MQNGAELIGLVADLGRFQHFQSQSACGEKLERAGGICLQAGGAPPGALPIALVQILAERLQASVIWPAGFLLHTRSQDRFRLGQVTPARGIIIFQKDRQIQAGLRVTARSPEEQFVA